MRAFGQAVHETSMEIVQCGRHTDGGGYSVSLFAVGRSNEAPPSASIPSCPFLSLTFECHSLPLPAHRRSFCQPLLWLAPYQETFGPESTRAPVPSPSSPSTLSRSELSLPAFLEAAFSQQLFGGAAPPSPVAAADAVIGNFNAAAIVQTLAPGAAAGGVGGVDDAAMLQVRAWLGIEGRAGVETVGSVAGMEMHM